MRESQIHDCFSRWLDANRLPYLHTRTDRKHTGVVGDPDYFVMAAGRVLAIEIKVGKNQLSPAQEKRVAYLRASGTPVEVVRNLTDAVAVTQRWATAHHVDAPVQSQESDPRNFCLGKWHGMDYVFAKDLDGHWSLIRKASPHDIANFMPMGL
jgi:hypothetical protein